MNNPFVGVSSYRTPADRLVCLLSRVFPSVAFYPRMFLVVLASSILSHLGRYDSDTWVEYSLRAMGVLERCGVKVSVEGLDRLNGLEGPAVFAANHMSTMETFLLPSILRPRGPLTFVVKQSLVEYPLFGKVLQTCDPIAVGRANPREDLAIVMGEGMERLNAGCSVVVFPQTTRTDTFDPGKFNSMAAKLAARAGVPLVPVALRTDAWSQGRILRDFGPLVPSRPVNLVFGEPLPPEGKGDKAHKASVEFISGVFAGWESPG